jgi:hypothetical protein
MKKIIFTCCLGAFLLSCNDEKKEATSAETKPAAEQPAADLPYKATYSSSFTQDVSDADLKTVLMTYKDWADGNMASLSKAMGDSVTVEFNDGNIFNGTNAELMKLWGTLRDSLSSVKIEMGAWNKMYSTDKKDSIIATWYDETDTYKTGKVDSAAYHDINVIKNGKIVFYAQYKRPKK